MNITTIIKRILLGIVILFFNFGFSQELICGIGLEEEPWGQTNNTTTSEINFFNPRWTAPLNFPMPPKKLRIQFWAVTKDDGTGGFQSLNYDLARRNIRRPQQNLCSL